MHPTLASLLADGPVLLDGAWGTQLQARGLPIGDCPDLWNAEHPDRVADVAAAYVAAGSRIILTNTFGANRFTLARHGAAARVRELNLAGARLSGEAAGGRAAVFGSIGPSGKLLAMGEATREEMAGAFAEQVEALAEGGVAGIVIETMSDLDEAEQAVLAAARTGLPVAASMTYGAGRDGDRTIMGTTPEQAAARLEQAGAEAVGANCGAGPVQMLPICRRLATATSLPVWMKPNAGLPMMIEGRAVYAMDAETFSLHMRDLVAAGARLVGGCCGTGPEFVAALRHTLAS